MGLFYTLRLYQFPDPARFRQAAEAAAAALGGRVEWGRPGDGDQDLRLSHGPDIQTLYLPYLGGRDADFCGHVGVSLDVPWIELRIQEGSIWDYALFRGGLCIDTFSVCHQYWGDADAAELRRWAGKPQVLADLWGLPVSRVERYLVNWGLPPDDEDDPILRFDRSGKAYPDDAYGYGNYEQFFDVLAALGGREPDESHRLILPPKRPNTR